MRNYVACRRLSMSHPHTFAMVSGAGRLFHSRAVASDRKCDSHVIPGGDRNKLKTERHQDGEEIELPFRVLKVYQACAFFFLV